MWALIAVTVPFSFAIAVLKDVPDIEGDRRFGIATFSVRLGPRPVLGVGRRRAHARRARDGHRRADAARRRERAPCSSPGTCSAWSRCGAGRCASIPGDPIAFAAFYQRVWQLFFCEYLLVPSPTWSATMRFIQHKAEARWFYRVVSMGYDRWINPLFWTAPMRDRALALGRLDDPGLEVVDVGAGTGFATEAIVRRWRPSA